MGCNGSGVCPDFMILVLLRHKFAAARRAGVSVYVENANNGVAQWQPQKIKQLEMALRQNFYALRRNFYYKLNSDAIRSETEMTTKQYLGHTRNPFILSMIVLRPTAPVFF